MEGGGGGLFWDVKWVIYFGDDIQGVLMYRVHIYRILQHFHPESVVWATAGMGPKPQNGKTKFPDLLILEYLKILYYSHFIKS